MWQPVWLMGTTVWTLPFKYHLPARPCTAGMAEARRHLTLIAAGLFQAQMVSLSSLACARSASMHRRSAGLRAWWSVLTVPRVVPLHLLTHHPSLPCPLSVPRSLQRQEKQLLV